MGQNDWFIGWFLFMLLVMLLALWWVCSDSDL